MIGTIGGGSPENQPPPSPQSVAGPTPFDGPPGFTGYATFGRRVGAYVIDAIPSLIIVAVGYSALFAAILGRSSGGLSTSLIVLLVGPIGYFVVLWAMAAKGSSPGNAMLGIRVVRDSTGAEPGAGLGLGRLLLKGLLIGVTCYIGGFSPLWDSSGRRKGWWDSACHTVVLDRATVPAYRAAVTGTQPPPPAALSLTGRPEPATVTGVPDEPARERAAPAVDDRPEWDVPPVPAPGPVPAPVPASATATWGDRPAESAAGGASGAAPAATPRPAPSGPIPDPLQDAPWAEPTSTASLIQAVPGIGSSRPAPAPLMSEPEPLDHTRMRVTPQSSSTPGWQAELDDGRVLTVDGPVILGRDPSGRPDEPAAVTVPVSDDTRSVSKTHLMLDVGPAGAQVTDRHSTNGVLVVTAGVDLRCVPGVATPVPDGSTVRFGDRSLVIRRA